MTLKIDSPIIVNPSMEGAVVGTGRIYIPNADANGLALFAAALQDPFIHEIELGAGVFYADTVTSHSSGINLKINHKAYIRASGMVLQNVTIDAGHRSIFYSPQTYMYNLLLWVDVLAKDRASIMWFTYTSGGSTFLSIVHIERLKFNEAILYVPSRSEQVGPGTQNIRFNGLTNAEYLGFIGSSVGGAGGVTLTLNSVSFKVSLLQSLSLSYSGVPPLQIHDTSLTNSLVLSDLAFGQGLNITTSAATVGVIKVERVSIGGNFSTNIQQSTKPSIILSDIITDDMSVLATEVTLNMARVKVLNASSTSISLATNSRLTIQALEADTLSIIVTTGGGPIYCDISNCRLNSMLNSGGSVTGNLRDNYRPTPNTSVPTFIGGSMPTQTRVEVGRQWASGFTDGYNNRVLDPAHPANPSSLSAGMWQGNVNGKITIALDPNTGSPTIFFYYYGSWYKMGTSVSIPALNTPVPTVTQA